MKQSLYLKWLNQAHKQYTVDEKEISQRQKQVELMLQQSSTNSNSSNISSNFRTPKRELKVHGNRSDLK